MRVSSGYFQNNVEMPYLAGLMFARAPIRRTKQLGGGPDRVVEDGKSQARTEGVYAMESSWNGEALTLRFCGVGAGLRSSFGSTPPRSVQSTHRAPERR
jgi:hypothetical protein